MYDTRRSDTGFELDDDDAGPMPSSLVRAEPALDALDLLAIASRAAARVACEQCTAIQAAARLLEGAARGGGCIWVTGDGADEHARRLNAAGHQALVTLAIDRVPPLLGATDVLLCAVLGEAPLALLAEARRQELESIVLGGPATIAPDGAAVLRIPCHDERALELTHGFIIMALCAEPVDAGRAESAA